MHAVRFTCFPEKHSGAIVLYLLYSTAKLAIIEHLPAILHQLYLSVCGICGRCCSLEHFQQI